MNRNALERSLKSTGIDYVYLGNELGGRSKAASDYDDDGRVRYDRMAQAQSFVHGIERVLAGARSHRIALLCAEKDPLECHRTLLIGRHLAKRGAAIAHIHPDGQVESDDAAMSRLLRLHGMQDEALFTTREELIDRACALQAKRVGWVDPTMRRRVIVVG
jgi:uncharacterized protein (DUF488 family)